MLRFRRARARQESNFDEQVIWIACSPRSGSTWLLHMLALQPRVVIMDEPLIGLHLGLWTADMLSTHVGTVPTDRQVWHRMRRDNPAYFFSEAYRDVWQPALRQLLLARFAAHAERNCDKVPQGSTPMLCIKEPAGTQAADMILGSLPAARFLHLVRDPRDVVASLLDAYRTGAWHHRSFPDAQYERVPRARRVEEFAIQWCGRAEIGMEAYDAHDPERRLLVRYEDLRAEPEPGLRRILEWAGLPTADVAEHVERRAFERGERARGEGAFHRKASPGSWREDLAPEEIDTIQSICAKPMATLGYEPIAVTAAAAAQPQLARV